MDFIVLCQSHDWEKYARRPHLTKLIKYGNLLVILSPIKLYRIFYDIKYLRNYRILDDQSKFQITVKNIFELFPFKFTKNKIIRKINNLVIKYQIYTTYKQLRLKPKIALLTTFWQLYYIDIFEGLIKWYELNDDYSLDYPPSEDIKSLLKKKLLIKIIKKSDIVFSVTENLKMKYMKFNKNIFTIINGCDYKKFSKTPNKIPEYLQILRKQRRPLLGMISGLNEWIDLDLIEYVIWKRPNWTIIFTAGISLNYYRNNKLKIDKILKKNNIFIFDWVMYEHLPFFIHLIDIGSLFYKSDLITSPNKIFMYMSQGKPVVSLDIYDEKSRFENAVYIAKDYEEFLTYCEMALNEKKEIIVQERMRIAYENSLDIKAKQKISIVKSKFSEFL